MHINVKYFWGIAFSFSSLAIWLNLSLSRLHQPSFNFIMALLVKLIRGLKINLMVISSDQLLIHYFFIKPAILTNEKKGLAIFTGQLRLLHVPARSDLRGPLIFFNSYSAQP